MYVRYYLITFYWGVSVFPVDLCELYVLGRYVFFFFFLLITSFGNNHLSCFLNFDCGVPDYKMKSQDSLGLEILSKIRRVDYCPARQLGICFCFSVRNTR